ncbi:uncharacterized protein LY79DRAFT_54016 [Colletotrichum navitas]|uniref:Uncharacterized protein n=1 Tax=Colletotrichum navitas TaxID=681940 RepID=A0AAD8PLX1_9PEZI|nr:uncharacterized protein LY79DRAFT_54016 [Colletotrichum navitas]KAK1570101.1 hypothetical protein LY79DRAFT_54016 [Colletotrichum navitas]
MPNHRVPPACNHPREGERGCTKNSRLRISRQCWCDPKSKSSDETFPHRIIRTEASLSRGAPPSPPPKCTTLTTWCGLAQAVRIPGINMSQKHQTPGSGFHGGLAKNADGLDRHKDHSLFDIRLLLPTRMSRCIPRRNAPQRRSRRKRERKKKKNPP